MPAPTALLRPDPAVEQAAVDAVNVPLPADDDDAELVGMSIDSAATPNDAPEPSTDDAPMTDETGRPRFAPAKSIPLAFRREQRKVPIPPHRMTPLKSAWPKIYVRRLPLMLGLTVTDLDVAAPRRTPQAPSPHEPQDQIR